MIAIFDHTERGLGDKEFVQYPLPLTPHVSQWGDKGAGGKIKRTVPFMPMFERDSQSMILRKRTAYANLLEQALQDIIERLSGLEGVERVSVFGSYAQGKRDLFTDLDLLVIMETEKGPLERLRMLYEILAAPVDLDLLCYTPREFEALKGRPFIRRILQEEVVLYEKKRP